MLCRWSVCVQVALCALRTEMRELLEGLRQETSSRVRILKERLDRTDRELLRQLEECVNPQPAVGTQNQTRPWLHP
jgi:hypothetical protein